MRKEVFVAIFIGLSIGLIVAFGVKIANESRLAAKKSSTTKSLSTNTIATAASEHNILITSPEANEILPSSPITIVGTTTPDSMVAGQSIVDNQTVLADDTGTFTLELNGAPGPNAISLTSFDPDGNTANNNFVIVISSADLESTASAKPK